MKYYVVVAALLSLAAASEVKMDWSNLVPLEPQVPFLPIYNGKIPPAGSRITGGYEALPHQFPYQVGLFILTEQGTSFCGGSLISDEWVLTAAHCAAPALSFTAVFAAHFIREPEPAQVHFQVTQKFVHPQYQGVQNDVALLRLPSKVQLSDKIQTIRLPRYSQVGESFENVLTTVSGWGRDSDSANTISHVLRHVQNPVIQNFVCNVLYFGSINDGHICTSGTGGRSTCNGDSGGPLVYEEADGKLTQIGIVSFGISFGCEVGWPPAFARVTHYLRWIEDVTGIQMRD